MTVTPEAEANVAVDEAFRQLGELDQRHAASIRTLDGLRINLTELALRFKPGDPKLVAMLAEKKALYKTTMHWLEKAPAQRRVLVKKLDEAKAALNAASSNNHGKKGT